MYVLLSMAAAPAIAQRVQFPSAIDEGAYSVYQPPATYGAVPPAAWDPYAASGAAAPPTYVPYGEAPPAQSGFSATLQKATRFLNRVDVRYQYLARGEDEFDMGSNDLDLSASFAIPFAYNPVLITPGFNFHFWDGPQTPDLPPQVYDGYLATSWQPEIGPRFSADIGVSVGVYTDFQEVDDDSIRIIGRGVGLYRFAPQWQVAVGAAYIDRIRIKLLPVGGLVWTPTSDARFELVFPRPKLAHRIATIGNTDVWGYVAGEYGGGAWSIEVPGGRDEVELDDMRIIVGSEWTAFNGWVGLFEVGYVFNREIVLRSDEGTVYEPDDTVMIRAGAKF